MLDGTPPWKPGLCDPGDYGADATKEKGRPRAAFENDAMTLLLDGLVGRGLARELLLRPAGELLGLVDGLLGRGAHGAFLLFAEHLAVTRVDEHLGLAFAARGRLHVERVHETAVLGLDAAFDDRAAVHGAERDLLRLFMLHGRHLLEVGLLRRFARLHAAHAAERAGRGRDGERESQHRRKDQAFHGKTSGVDTMPFGKRPAYKVADRP